MEQNYFLAKWLNNEITEAELMEHLSEEEIRTYKKIITASNQFEVPVYNAEEALEKIKLKHTKSKVKKLNFFNSFYKVAAVLAIIVASYYFISNKNTTYTTNFAEKTSFELPDNSNVRLNADSEITFKPKNWENNRAVTLNGEAYFSVFKGSTFTVNTAMGTVTVLGTKFNVVVRDHYFEVNCYEGVVSATYQNKTIKVPAGSSFKVLNSVSLFGEITETNPSWIENNSSFKSMPYKYVIQEIERQYNIAIVYDVEYATTLFTGNFTHTDLEMALQAISIPLNLKYTIISDKKVRLHQ
ncbi:MAG: FecR family protein [Lutibacter sp.]|nr:FecR family protein [Lutibacter sp.]